MSIKNDIEMVKEELTSEEKFFEKSVITERFVKKYKNMIISSVVAIIVLVGANIAYDMNKESTAIAANEALNELFVDSKNIQALARLKTLSPDLHDAFIYSRAVADDDIKALEKLKSSKANLIGDLADYESMKNSKDVSVLNAYAMKQDSIYKDLASVQNAIVYISNGNTQKAHEVLSSINDTSSLSKVAAALSHYGVK